MNKSRLIKIAGALVLALAIAAGGYLILSERAAVRAVAGGAEQAWRYPSTPAQVQPTAIVPVRYPQPGEGIMYDAGARIVNLLDPVGRLYLKIGLVIEFLPPDYTYYQLDKEEQAAVRTTFLTDLEQFEPLIQDLITTVLTNKTYEDVRTLEGKNLLRAELIDRLNQTLPGYEIMNVYFTEFIVQ